MVFRLLGVTLLSLILRDLLGLPNRWALGLVLLTSGILFSLYHYLSPDEHFRSSTFIFRTAAGTYFGLLYVLRGFGITAGTHAAYDLVVVVLLTRG
jgi:membrane protease YdiL (CAAX protease family)